MVNYNLGKVYMIECLTTNKKYYGASCVPSLAIRLAEHVSKYKKWIEDKTRPYYSSFEVLEGGNYQIVLLKSHPCANKDELRAEEATYIRQGDCVNNNIPNRTQKEWFVENKEYCADYRKQYRKKNIEVYTQRDKTYRDKNRESLKEKYSKIETCEICECSFTHSGSFRHRKSKKHLKNLNAITEVKLVPDAPVWRDVADAHAENSLCVHV